ncbi:MAG TPA: BMP family ABC transporter substrate-binding protein, partial [Sphaerochaetaceae bacterium]|nr:BMP family ABC transporter substrate-binding protein [Sphaerochaetaceae bacterium]
DFRKIVGHDNVLVSPIWHWDNYMIPAIESALNGTWETQSYWGGVDDGMVDLSPISPIVPADVQAEVMAVYEKIENGEWDVFWGRLRDNTGRVRQNAGEKMSDEAMLTMDWFVEGVIGSVK